MKHLKKFLHLLTACILLSSCEKALIPENEANYNLDDFEVAWQTTKDRYPYFELKNVDWDALYVEYYPQAAASQGDEIYTVLLDMFAHLQDGHMYLEMEGGATLTPWIPDRRRKDIQAFSPAVIGKYFDKELLVDSEGIMNYQVLPQNIAYLNIVTFSGEYNFSDITGIFQYFSQTDGLIVDVRHNYGGNIKNVDKLVRNFIETPIQRNPYYFEFDQLEMDSIRPGGNYTYTNPAVLLINGVSFSASEICSELFKHMIPQATLIGDTTGGGSLGFLNEQNNGDFRLPSGKLFHIGNLDVRKYDFAPFENTGIVPDILVPQTEADILSGVDKQLEYAIGYLMGKN